MRYPQILIHESDGRLAALVLELAQERKWAVREPRSLDACLRLLRQGMPSVLVLRVGRDLVRELSVLERVQWLCPDTQSLVVTDAPDSSLVELAWDLGAAHVVVPPQSPQLVPALVADLMAAAIERQVALAGRAGAV
jgi:DNA-binding response OmpR family regulator